MAWPSTKSDGDKIFDTEWNAIINTALHDDTDNDLGAHYIDIGEIAEPASPVANKYRLYVDNVTGEISLKDSAGSVFSLQGGNVTYQPKPVATATRDLTATGSTTILSATEVGMLYTITLVPTGAVTGNPSMRLEINMDGGGAENIPIYSSSNTWETDLSNVFAGNGDSGSDRAVLFFFSPYYVSVSVVANCTFAGSAGSLEVYLRRGVQV